MVFQAERGGRMNLIFKDVRLRLGGMVLELNVTLDRKTTALFGPSGSGKTSILELVAGLRQPEKGSIEWDGTLLVDVSRRVFVSARQRAMGYIPQDLALFPHQTVRQNIQYGRPAARSFSHPEISFEKLCRVLEIERLLDRSPGSLSGGKNSAWLLRGHCCPRLACFFSMNHWPASIRN